MKIGLVSSTQQTCPPFGYGSEAATWDLAVALERAGHAVRLFAPAGSAVPNGGLIELPTSTQNDSRDLGDLESSFPLEAVSDLDVVHDLSLNYGAHARVCHEFKCGKPHLCTLNGISYQNPEAPYDHNVVVVSEAARVHAKTGESAWSRTPHLKLYPGKLRHEPRVVRYGRNAEFYRPQANRDDYILYVGRPHPAKGIDLILDLAAAWPEQRFVLTWRAALPDHVRCARMYLASARRLKNVEFVELPVEGHHEAKRDLLARAKVFLHPNVYVDACPVVVIEAQLCGAPVATFGDRGGAPEITKNGETAVLVDIPDSYWARRRETSDLLRAACERAAALDRRAVRAWAAANLSAQRMANEYQAIYTQLSTP